jgi:hypothetical protein
MPAYRDHAIAIAAVLDTTGIEMAGRVWSVPGPERCSFEITVGETTWAFTFPMSR